MFYTLSLAGLIAIIGFAGNKNVSRNVDDVVVRISDQNGDFFTDQLEIIDLLNAEGTDYVLGLSIDHLDLKQLESRVEAHPFVEDAQVYKDVKGQLVVNVTQSKPVARIFRRGKEDQYIDEHGNLLPTITKHTSRVLILQLEHEFSWKDNITETDYGTNLLHLLNHINDDIFWKAQIAGIVVKRDGELNMLPQVTKQEIVFGLPEDLEEKFKKLKVFYKQVLPNKGWNTYSMVNVKFKNQLVCE